MADEFQRQGISSAGEWDLCFKCNDWVRWDERGSELKCTKCHLTKKEASAVEANRPNRINAGPSLHQVGEEITISYWLQKAQLPVNL